MSSGRYGEPLPLGEPGGLPYSKGLMARALVAAGVSIERAYELATRIEVDLAERDARSTDLDRVEELACEVLGFEEGSDVVHASSRLADRDALRGELARLDADTYLVEVKAAAIDVVAEDALARDRRVVLAANDVVGDGLDEALLGLLPAMERAA